MVNRLTDSLKKASARATEFMTSEASDKPKLFLDFINGLKVAAGCSHQLAHSRLDQSPFWLAIRDNLESVIEVGQKMPVFTGEQNFFWRDISKSLTELSKGIDTLFASKALPFATIDKMLDQRLKDANLSVN